MTERENEMTAMNTSGKRQVKAAEVKPGMTVRWKSEGFTHEGTVGLVISDVSAYRTRFINSPFVMDVLSDTLVTVLSEPQPEEPTEFGARVVAGGLMFVRIIHHELPWCVSLDGELYDWSDVCGLGPVTVIPDQGWTVPAEPTPVVPERLCVWPENDEHLRGYKWCDSDGDTIQYVDGAWRYLWPSGPGAAHAAPVESAPWTRTDAMSEEIGASDWPEDDGHLRGHSWRDHNGNSWTWNRRHSEWDCKDPYGSFLTSLGTPSNGPWTRRDV